MFSRKCVNKSDMSGESIKSTIYWGLVTNLVKEPLREDYIRWWHITIRCARIILCSIVLWNTKSYSNHTKLLMNMEWNEYRNCDIYRDNSIYINIGLLSWATSMSRSLRRVNRLIKVIWYKLGSMSRLW